MKRLTISKLRKKLGKLYETRPKLMPLPAGRGKPRVLYFIVSYPTFSETYMHEEISSLSRDFDIKIITYRKSDLPRRRAWDYTRIDYKAPCPVYYANVEGVNQNFDDPNQTDFLRRVNAVIEEFKPDILYGHYLGMGVLLKKLAEQHQIPFTLRSHSMDVLAEPHNKLETYCQVLNSPWCRRVLAFPFSCDRLTERGLDPTKLKSCWPIMNFARFYQPERRDPTGRVMCCGPAIKKKAHKDFIDLAAMMRGTSHLKFDLYAGGRTVEATRARNKEKNAGVNITYVDPENMPEVYTQHDWLVYPSDPTINKVGLPVAIAEAQASGIGVCWQELPGRREEQLDYLNGGGFLYKSIDELPEILLQPYPEQMRQAGFAAAKRCDIEQHRHLLCDVWESIAAESRALSA